MEAFWLVAKAKAQRELWAAENLTRLGFQYYMPMTIPPAQHFTGSLKIARAVPVFPGYIFVFSDGRWRVLLSTYGLCGVVMRGDGPAPIATKQIEALKAREDKNGLVQLPKRNFSHNSQVCITRGLMAGQRGVFAGDAGQDRVRVLIDYLGRKTPVLIEEGLLEAA